MFKRALDLRHLNIIPNFSLIDKSNNFILDLALVNILIFLFYNHLSIENILTLRTHHAHFAYQMMRHVFHLGYFRLVDKFWTWGLLFDLHFLMFFYHRFDGKLFGVFYLEMMVTTLRNVEPAVEVIDIVFVLIWRLDHFDRLFRHIEVLLIRSAWNSVFTLTISQLFATAIFRDYLIHLFEAYLC